jgi:large subunit ribosomal protein L2
MNTANVKQEKDCFSYILAPKGLKVFDKVQTINEKRNNFNIRSGDSSVLHNFEPGDLIHAVESFPGKGAVFARSAGTYCQILQHFSLSYAKVKLPSGSQRYVSLEGKGTFGVIGRESFYQQNLKKAGRNR